MHQNDSDWPREPTLLNAESRGIRGRACFRANRRQGKVERRAAPAVAGGPDPSAMRFDDRFADGQAHAAALWLRGEEGIEDLIRSSGWESSGALFVVWQGRGLAYDLRFRQSCGTAFGGGGSPPVHASLALHHLSRRRAVI
jgi:hypothetical protein